MTNYNSLIAVFWLIFLVYWLVSAFFSKKTVRGGQWWQWAYIRLGIVVVLLLILHFSNASVGNDLLRTFDLYGPSPSGVIWSVIGIIICLAGMALAVWARLYLGRNWGMPMSLKENPELITGGPYAYVRHPIYTGFLTAMIGSVIVTGGLYWLVVFVICCFYFTYSARTEEKIMTEQFPDQYPEYKKRTKMLIPLIF